jgi:arylsulfatase A-like enzyme
MADVDRPNVLVFFTDQQRWDTVGAYGSPLDLTPNLDAAAAEGTVAETAVTSQPVCAPARACLQTGQHATTHGVYTNAGTLPDVDHLLARTFDRAGYETGYVGKWHIAGTVTDPVPAADRGGYRDYWRVADSLEHTTHPYEGVLYDEAGERVEFDGYRVDALTDMAVEFIERERDAPFFLTLSQIEPHHQNDMETYVAPEGYAYDHRNPWVPPDLRGQPGDWHEELPDYYGICERLDECYGRVLRALEETGILEETVVLFVSDHGSHFRTRNGEYKRSCHESSVRVPMVFRGPGFSGGNRVSTPVSLVDVAPTLLDATGITVPDPMEGESIVPFVGDGPEPDRDAFIQTSEAQVGRALRTDRWKYAVYAPEADSGTTPQPDEYVERYLYDLAADPYEQTNLVGRSEYREVADNLRRRLRERIEAVEGESTAIRRATFHA